MTSYIQGKLGIDVAFPRLMMKKTGPIYTNTFVHKFDKQNRVSIPKDWRPDKDNPIHYYLVPAPNRKIHAVAREDFMLNYREPLSHCNVGTDALKQETAMFFGRFSYGVCPDSQGRITVSDALIKWGMLGPEVTLAGMFDVFSITWAHEPANVKEDVLKDLTYELPELFASLQEERDALKAEKREKYIEPEE